jgi:hypothetical protein
VVEIGTGWGGFALHAAQHYGCHVTTTTISAEQHALATGAYAAGLQDQVTLLMQDYRDLQGQFDKLVSIEMIEAIGAEYLDTYMATLQRLLKPDGVALLQAITIEDHRYEQARRSVDYIKRYVFPGSFIPSINAIMAAKTRSSDLQLIAQQDFGHSYALTCAPGANASWPSCRQCRRRALTRASAGCGSSTWPIARVASWSVRSASRICCWPVRAPARWRSVKAADMRRFWANLLGNQLVWLCRGRRRAAAGSGLRCWPRRSTSAASC